MGDAAVLEFLEANGIATYPTREAIVAAAVDMNTLLSWGEEDMKLFFETSARHSYDFVWCIGAGGYNLPKQSCLLRFESSI